MRQLTVGLLLALALTATAQAEPTTLQISETSEGTLVRAAQQLARECGQQTAPCPLREVEFRIPASRPAQAMAMALGASGLETEALKSWVATGGDLVTCPLPLVLTEPDGTVLPIVESAGLGDCDTVLKFHSVAGGFIDFHCGPQTQGAGFNIDPGSTRLDAIIPGATMARAILNGFLFAPNLATAGPHALATDLQCRVPAPVIAKLNEQLGPIQLWRTPGGSLVLDFAYGGRPFHLVGFRGNSATILGNRIPPQPGATSTGTAIPGSSGPTTTTNSAGQSSAPASTPAPIEIPVFDANLIDDVGLNMLIGLPAFGPRRGWALLAKRWEDF